MRDRSVPLQRLAAYTARSSAPVAPPTGSGRHRSAAADVGAEPPSAAQAASGGSGWVPNPALWRDLPADEDDDDSDDSDEAAGRARSGRVARLRSRAWGRFAELWIPESLTEARVDAGRRGAVVLLIVATIAAIATAIGVWRDRPQARPVEAMSIAAAASPGGAEPSAATPAGSAASQMSPSAGPPAGAAAPSGTAGPVLSPEIGTPPGAAEPMVVSVTGEVVTPGLVTLPGGSRVMDAISAAGGPTPAADYTGLNLATRLADGASIVVGGTGEHAAPGGVSGAEGTAPVSDGGEGDRGSAPVNLNTADAADLDALPGVGPVMAQNILAWRSEHGRFASVEQLQEISGIGPGRYAQLSALVTV